MVIKGAMNGESFLAYVEQCLVPPLKRGDMWWPTMYPSTRLPVWRRRSRVLAQASDTCRQYSQGLNPIELVFYPAKTFLRKAAERTIEGLHRCVRSFIRTIDPSECISYFRHAGYEPL